MRSCRINHRPALHHHQMVASGEKMAAGSDGERSVLSGRVGMNEKPMAVDAGGAEELRLIRMARRAMELANTRRPRRRRTHEILMTADLDRLVAFAAMKDFDYAQTDSLPMCHDPATDADGWASSQLLRQGVAACFSRKTGGPIVLAFAAEDSFADPFLGYSGEKFPAVLEPHPSSNQHLVLRFETRRDFWVAAGTDLMLVTPGGATAGLVACPIRLEMSKLDQLNRLRYVFRSGTVKSELRRLRPEDLGFAPSTPTATPIRRAA